MIGSSGFVRTFNIYERHRIRAEAARRVRNHPRTRSWTIDKRENEERNERMGVAGEWAAHNWLGLSEDPVFMDHGPGGDGGVDLRLPDGRCGDVMATACVTGRLILPPYQKKVELAVMCIAIKGTATIRAAGYANWQDWVLHQYQHDFHHGVGPQPVMDQGKLRPFGELVDEVTQRSE